MESTGISFTRGVLKGSTFNAEYYRINSLTELLPLPPQVDGRRLVIHVDNARRHTAESPGLFATKIGFASPYTHHTHLIWHHPTSFSSNISKIIYRESLFHHVNNDLLQFMKLSGPSRDQPWRTFLGTEWRDSNGFLRIMMTSIHKLNTG
jgi:hypothetical protein